MVHERSSFSASSNDLIISLFNWFEKFGSFSGFRTKEIRSLKTSLGCFLRKKISPKSEFQRTRTRKEAKERKKEGRKRKRKKEKLSILVNSSFHKTKELNNLFFFFFFLVFCFVNFQTDGLVNKTWWKYKYPYWSWNLHMQTRQALLPDQKGNQSWMRWGGWERIEVRYFRWKGISRHLYAPAWP